MPTPKHNPYPFKRQRSHRHLVGCSLVTLLLVVRLRQEVLDEGFVGRSGYFYQIRAVVKGQISPELRRNLLDGAQTSPSPPGITPPVSRQFKLIVNVTPVDSVIKIMNIKPTYFPRIALEPGQYDLLVQRDGYEAVRRWVAIRDTDVSLDIRLQQDTPEQIAHQHPITQSPKHVERPDEVSQQSTQVARLEAETKQPGKTVGRFIKYDNGTALDTKTNLMWMTKDFCNVEGRHPKHWDEAMAWAAKMNQQHYGGYNDWRVPTPEEYEAIYDSKKTKLSYANKRVGYPEAFEDGGGYWYWTNEVASYFGGTGPGNQYQWDIPEIFGYNFRLGVVLPRSANDFSRSNSVRLVRRP